MNKVFSRKNNNTLNKRRDGDGRVLFYKYNYIRQFFILLK